MELFGNSFLNLLVVSSGLIAVLNLLAIFEVDYSVNRIQRWMVEVVGPVQTNAQQDHRVGLMENNKTNMERTHQKMLRHTVHVRLWKWGSYLQLALMVGCFFYSLDNEPLWLIGSLVVMILFWSERCLAMHAKHEEFSILLQKTYEAYDLHRQMSTDFQRLMETQSQR